MQELDDLTAYALATELGIDDEVLEVVARREFPADDQTDGDALRAETQLRRWDVGGQEVLAPKSGWRSPV